MCSLIYQCNFLIKWSNLKVKKKHFLTFLYCCRNVSLFKGKKSTPELTSMQMKIILNEVQQNKKGKKIPKLKKYSPKSKFSCNVLML